MTAFVLQGHKHSLNLFIVSLQRRHQHPLVCQTQLLKPERKCSNVRFFYFIKFVGLFIYFFICNGVNLLSVHIEPTLDPSSAFRHVRLSDGYHKATLCAEKQNYPEHPDRFMFWRQVMCVEPLAGSPYYWEVEWTGPRVTTAFTTVKNLATFQQFFYIYLATFSNF